MNREMNDQLIKFLEFEKMFPPFIRDMESGLCIPEVAKNWEWCFDPLQSYLLEKLNGTNVKLEVEDYNLNIFGRDQNNKGYVPVQLNNPQFKYISQGVVNSIAKRSKRLESGTYYGEVIGPTLCGNPYKLDTYVWIDFRPFKGGAEVYKDAPKTNSFEEWKEWVLGLKSFFNPDVEAEGVIFLNKQTGQMAKLRKDMFSTAYQQPRNRKKKYKKII
jgi:hypothetical protein